jgi:hypothetical protein
LILIDKIAISYSYLTSDPRLQSRDRDFWKTPDFKEQSGKIDDTEAKVSCQ